jgi:glycosyltransferase involved in cell wall biosynthesis
VVIPAHGLRVLVMTKIFPNAVEPLAAPFNRQQLAALGRRCEVEVLATIPWFPGVGLFRRWSAAGRLTEVPRREVIDGLAVAHPRFLFLPKVGRAALGTLYAASLLPSLLRRRHRIDLLLGSWAYPDGFAAVVLGRLLAVPSVVKLHGSDIDVVAALPGVRRMVRWALARADRVVAVSGALVEAAVRLGARPERIDLVRNGVDETLFHPADPTEARAELGLDGRTTILYAGRLEREKGVLDLLQAFAALAPRRPDLALLLLGEGGARAACEAAAARSRDGQVRVFGARPLGQVPRFLAAADLVTLPSWHEGTPNVLLEAQACGRAIVATRVGGIPEVVHAPSLGELVEPHDPAALAAALERVADGVKAGHYPASQIAAIGGCAGWADSASRLHGLLVRADREYRGGA